MTREGEGGKEEGAKSYDGEKAWSSLSLINYILSGTVSPELLFAFFFHPRASTTSTNPGPDAD
jgi:hypothetical protein